MALMFKTLTWDIYLLVCISSHSPENKINGCYELPVRCEVVCTVPTLVRENLLIGKVATTEFELIHILAPCCKVAHWPRANTNICYNFKKMKWERHYVKKKKISLARQTIV